MNGIQSVILNGKVPAKQRHSFIEAWRLNPAVPVLIMSSVGAAGLNLAFARNLLLYVRSRIIIPRDHTHSLACRTLGGPKFTGSKWKDVYIVEAKCSLLMSFSFSPKGRSTSLSQRKGWKRTYS